MKVWDGFVRFFHWTMVLLIAGLYFTAEEGMMELHMLCGYTLMALVATRLVWGIIGSDTAKLKALFHSPKSAVAALTDKGDLKPGHSPSGSYMVLAFFALLIGQIVSGLMTTDDIMVDGPLVQYVDSAWVSIASEWHEVNFDILLIAIIVHVLAIVIYRMKGKNLLGAMVTGKNPQVKEASGSFKPSWWAFIVFAVLLGVVMMTWGQDPISML